MNRYRNSQRQRIKGLSLIELAIMVSIMGIISASIFALSSNMIQMHSSISEERFKTVLRSVLSDFYLDNIPSRSGLEKLIGSEDRDAYKIANTSLNSYKSLGAGDVNFSHDGTGNNWFYVACSTVGAIKHSHIKNNNTGGTAESLHYCDIIGYTTNNNTEIPVADLKGKTIKNWEDRAGNLSTVSDYVIVRGKPIVSQIVDNSWADIVKTRTAMEAYYTQQYQKNRDLGFAVSRFANGPKAPPTNEEFYDLESIFRNTEEVSTDSHEFDPSELFGLGLADEDVSTVLGDLRFDNGSSNVRHPENSSPPYTVELWYTLCPPPDCTSANSVIMEAVASSGSP